jgi:hypothetical protein
MMWHEYAKAWLDAIEGDEKFVMTMGAGIVNTLLILLGVLDQGTYAMLTISTVAAYITGKTVENVSANKQ